MVNVRHNSLQWRLIESAEYMLFESKLIMADAGEILYKRRWYDAAIEAYRSVISAQPRFPEYCRAMFKLAQSYKRTGRRDLAVETLADKCIELDEKDAEKLLRMVDMLEDLDDVQNVYTNAEISDEILDALD